MRDLTWRQMEIRLKQVEGALFDFGSEAMSEFIQTQQIAV